MNKPKESPQFIFDKFLPWVVLAILLLYTYAKFFEHPYIGFRVGPPGDVILIFVERGAQPTLEVGDQIIEIDSVRWEDFLLNLRMNIFEDVRPGQVLSLLFERGRQQISIPWKVPGFNLPDFIDLLISEGWLGFFVPAATPKEIVTKLSDELARIIASPEGVAGIETLSLIPVGGSAEAFEKALRRDHAKWADVVKATGVKGE